MVLGAKTTWKDKLRCFFLGKHRFVNMEINGIPTRYCRHCPYTEYKIEGKWVGKQRIGIVDKHKKENGN